MDDFYLAMYAPNLMYAVENAERRSFEVDRQARVYRELLSRIFTMQSLARYDHRDGPTRRICIELHPFEIEALRDHGEPFARHIAWRLLSAIMEK